MATKSTWERCSPSAGIVDRTNFYGRLSSQPADAIVRCPIDDCSVPQVIARGQSNASAFTQDAAANYWVTVNPSYDGYTIWKQAK